jgi:hypothetical protein
LIHEPVPITASMALKVTGAAAAAVEDLQAQLKDGDGALFCPREE